MDDRVRVRIRVGVGVRVRVRDNFTSRSQSMFALRADKDAFENTGCCYSYSQGQGLGYMQAAPGRTVQIWCSMWWNSANGVGHVAGGMQFVAGLRLGSFIWLRVRDTALWVRDGSRGRDRSRGRDKDRNRDGVRNRQR